MVDRSSFSSVGSLFHARGAATEKALTPIRRRVRGTTRSPNDEACRADRAGTSATDVSKSEMYTPRRVSKKRLVDYMDLGLVDQSKSLAVLKRSDFWKAGRKQRHF